MKETINQIKNSIERITNRQFHLEDRTADKEDKIFNLENKVVETQKMVRNYDWNLKKLCDIIKRPNLKFIRIEEGTETQTKGMNNLFNKIVAENFPNLMKEVENEIQGA